MIRYYFITSWMVALFSALNAERGIVVACNDKYAEYLIPSIAYLRGELHSTLPIQVWYDGDELSSSVMERLRDFQPLICIDIRMKMGRFDTSYRGYQIKPYMIAATDFDEVILMDADVYFHQDPKCLFDDPGYRQTGAYFFRDLTRWQYPITHTVEQYVKRRTFFKKLINSPSNNIPPEWRHYWRPYKTPTVDKPLLEAHQEAGCVVFNKKKHVQGLKNIVGLNKDRKVTYTIVSGDKETFWLGLEMAKEPFTLNPTYPLTLKEGDQQIDVVHFYQGKILFHQKNPIEITDQSTFLEDNESRFVTEGEKHVMNKCFYSKPNRELIL